MVEDFSEKVSLLKCGLWFLENLRFQKQQDLSYFSHLRTKHFPGALKIPFLRKVDKYLKFP